MRQLAAEGKTADEISEIIGMKVERVRQVASRFDIPIIGEPSHSTVLSMIRDGVLAETIIELTGISRKSLGVIARRSPFRLNCGAETKPKSLRSEKEVAIPKPKSIDFTSTGIKKTVITRMVAARSGAELTRVAISLPYVSIQHREIGA